MSRREVYEITREGLILNAKEQSIYTNVERNFIETYKKLFNEIEFSKKSVLAYESSKIKRFFNYFKIQSLHKKIKENRQHLLKIECAQELSNFFLREEQRVKKELENLNLALESKEIKGMESLLKNGAYISDDDAYYDELLLRDREQFWLKIKLQWVSKNPGKTHIRNVPLIKHCDAISFNFSIYQKETAITVKQMREKLLCENFEGASSMTVLEVLSYYNSYYIPTLIR